MKDRRNTNLSISTASIPSNSSSPVDGPDIDLVEKGRFLLLPPRLHDAALPSPLLKHAQEQQARQPGYRRFLTHLKIPTAIFVFLLASFFLWRCLAVASSFSLPSFTSSSPPLTQLQAISPPADPEPVLFEDSDGRKRWTISIPERFGFPLRPSQYRDMCSKGYGVRKTIRDTQEQLPRIKRRTSRPVDAYYSQDDSYMEIHEAIARGILNSTQQPPIAVVGGEPQPSLTKNAPALRMCDRSLTFVLEMEEAGFGKALLSLWLSYGLARRERRAFFIEDSKWQYGRYLSFFPKPPQPACIPPPPSQVVSCPRQAAHLAVSAATLSETFGSKFHDYYLSPHRSGLDRQRNVFQMARQGYEALFGLNGEDAAYAEQRVALVRDAAKSEHYPVVGVHVRRGDRHPFEYEFHHDYLPLERFTAAATGVIESSRRPKSVNMSQSVPLFVASDDPDIVMAPDLKESDLPVRLERVQERIVLASKRNLQPTVPERQGDSAFVKHVDEVLGWEGGFFASLFRGLGRDNRAHHLTFSSAREQRVQLEELIRANREKGDERQLSEDERKAEENAASMRKLVGRGYLLDLDVLGRGGDAVVCAVSSATCRLLGVIMGWDKVKHGRWINVDDGRGWSWDGQH
ncbi:hypothetical protein ANO11243_045270 [Dothideomycetidae sp. 11243]|nr:hypothetical protein ANO11243_045270 [fungal sp. No.11243]